MKKSFSPVCEAGLIIEARVEKALKLKGFPARHASREEDLSGWDLEVKIRGFTARIDLTISEKRLLQKRDRNSARTGLIIPVWVSPRWSDDELVREVIEQVVYNLPRWQTRAMLAAAA